MRTGTLDALHDQSDAKAVPVRRRLRKIADHKPCSAEQSAQIGDLSGRRGQLLGKKAVRCPSPGPLRIFSKKALTPNRSAVAQRLAPSAIAAGAHFRRPCESLGRAERPPTPALSKNQKSVCLEIIVGSTR